MPVVRELPAHFLSPDATPISSIPLSPPFTPTSGPPCAARRPPIPQCVPHTAGECDCVSLRRPSCSLPRQSLDGRTHGRADGGAEGRRRRRGPIDLISCHN